jgi:DNA polymerase-1
MIDLNEIFKRSQSSTHSTRDDRVLIIDGTNTFLRVCASLAHFNENGINVGAISGFLKSIAMNIRNFNASRCIVVFDGKGGSKRRKELYPDYKANRKDNPFKPKRPEGFSMTEAEERENMKWQLQRILCYMDCLPIHVMTGEGVEADDLVAFICKQYYNDNPYEKIRIVSTDRDFLQLVNEKIEVYSPVKKKLYTVKEIEEEFGIKHENYILYRTITGDTSDNIKGIRGAGLPTIIKNMPYLTTEVFTMEKLFDRVESEQKKSKILSEITNNKRLLELNHQLMQLSEVDIPTTTKLLINNKLQSNINKIDRFQFKKYLIEDYLTGSFKNFDEWIRSFSKMSMFSDG